MLRVLATIFGFMGLLYFALAGVQLAGIDALNQDSDFQKLDSRYQATLIQTTYLYTVLHLVGSLLAFSSTAGLLLKRRFGWFAGVTLVLLQIVIITGLLDKERATHFILPREIMSMMTQEGIEQTKTTFVPLFIDGIFVMLVANITIVTFLTLPRVLAVFKLPTDLLASRVGKGH